MGRDDNKAIPGLQGGRAPAQAFHDFMIRAVASRPIEQFETQVAPPDWAETEPDEEVWYDAPGNQGQMVDADGNPVSPPPAAEAPLTGTDEPRRPQPQETLEDLVERATDPDRGDRQPVPVRPPERSLPPRDRGSTADPVERRSSTPQP
jgi:penicillin-binding protein 1A